MGKMTLDQLWRAFLVFFWKIDGVTMENDVKRQILKCGRMNLRSRTIQQERVFEVIELNATLSNGTNKVIVIESHSKRVDISNESIIAIDLSELDNLQEIEELVLSENRLMTVDLTVLAFCPAMKAISLNKNNLQIANLEMLSYCTLLEQLDLGSNQIMRIDLSPLSECMNLVYLNLENNRLMNLDLIPISKCGKLEELNILENPLKRLDVTPLFSCASLRSIMVPENTRLVSRQEQEIEILNPPAINELIAAGRIEFLLE
jgi:Leucine-rich repeat (LRR) protein